MAQALLAAATLLLQVVVPAIHPLHGAAASADHGRHAACAPVSGHVDHGLGHDAVACVFCAAAAQGRVGALSASVAPLAVRLALDTVVPSLPHGTTAPSLTRAAPRAPPARV
ncbi:hypothetical protein KF840_23720 [bacterium]|nr:hypothetical protein [bacterium]